MKKFNVSEVAKKRAEENKIAIHEYFKSRPFDTQGECAKALGLTQATVSKHVIALRQEVYGGE